MAGGIGAADPICARPYFCSSACVGRTTPLSVGLPLRPLPKGTTASADQRVTGADVSILVLLPVLSRRRPAEGSNAAEIG